MGELLGKGYILALGTQELGKICKFSKNGRVAEPANFSRILRWMVEILVTCPNPSPANMRTHSVRSLESFWDLPFLMLSQGEMVWPVECGEVSISQGILGSSGAKKQEPDHQLSQIIPQTGSA